MSGLSGPNKSRSPPRPRNGTSKKAATGSAHHQSNATFALRPNRVMPDTQTEAIVLHASSRNAALASEAAKASFARLSARVEANDTPEITIPKVLATGMEPVPNRFEIDATATQRQKRIRTAP